MKKVSLKKSLLTPLTLALVILLSGFLFNVYRSNFKEVTYDVEQELDSVDKLFAKLLDAESELISSAIDLIKEDHHIREAWEAKDRQKLLDLCTPLMADMKAKLHITHFYFHDINRYNFLRVYSPQRYGDIINRTTLLNAEKTGAKSSGVELGGLGTLTIRVVHPWIINNELTGYIEMGEEIDHIIEKLHYILGVELYVSIYKEFLERETWEQGMGTLGRPGNWEQFPTSVIINHTTEEIPEEFSEFLIKGKHQYMEMETDLQLSINDKYYRVGVIPVFDNADREVGDIVMLFDVTSRIASLNRTIMQTGFLWFGVGFILFLLFYKFFNKVEAQLDKYRNHLEELVQNRTEELVETNVLLEEEILGHKITEEALKESEMRYRSFVQEFNGIAFRKNVRDSSYVFFHGAVKELTGFTEDDFISGRIQWENLINSMDMSNISEAKKGYAEPDFIFKGEYRIFTKNGEEKWVFENIYNICDAQGVPLFIEGTLHDITKRKKLEEELQKTHKLESLGLLAGGIAHDFNNLLTGIQGNISISKLKLDKEDKVYEILTRAEKATQRASSLTQQLLTFSRGGEPIKISTNIDELLKESINFVLSGSKVRCNFTVADDLWPVDIDRGQISQVVHNLTLNALEAMPDGGFLQVHAQNSIIAENENNLSLAPGKYVKLGFEDEGIGIEKKNLDKIFDPYFTTKKSGNGLGLSATYSIVKKHSGAIYVDSTPGSGTKVCLYLPSTDQAPAAELALQEEISPGKGKVLIMDDEEVIRDVITESLTSIGYDVDATKDGDEAIQYYLQAHKNKTPYDAVILDLTVPGGKGGKETIQELRQIDPAAKVIVSSGYSQDPIMADFKQFGFIDVVPKPYNINELSAVLYKIIGSEMDGT